jgi:ribosomal protein S18 acetylase RimI-like enzyme
VTEVRAVTARETAALRQLVLRPFLTVEEVLAQSDDAVSIAVYDGDTVIACASPRPEPMPEDPQPNDWRLRGMATHPDLRGNGHGAAALDAAMDHARERGGARMWCNARSPARGFYERHGFEVRGEEFEVERIGPHYLMWRAL